MDFVDWFVAGQLTAAWIAATVFLFKHPDPANFVTWAGLCGTTYGCYHWMVVRDQKIPDAGDNDGH